MYVSAYMDRKFKTEEGKLRLMELSSKTWSAAFRKEPKYIVVQDTFNLVKWKVRCPEVFIQFLPTSPMHFTSRIGCT